MNKKNAFLDTNIILHYDIYSIDWPKELKADEVELIICPTVLDELDKHKINPNKTIAKRARNNLTKINKIIENNQYIGSKTTMSYISTEPDIDWKKESLDYGKNDDRIIASIVERKNNNDVLVTDDSTPRVKAKSRDIEVIKLKDNLKKPESKNEEEKEIEKLKKELLELKTRIPELCISILSENEDSQDKLTLDIKHVQTLSDSEIEEQISQRKKELEFKQQSHSLPMIKLIPLDTNRYEKDVGYHLPAFRKYLKEYNIYEIEKSKTLTLNFRLECHGKTPAENVTCLLNFPNGFNLIEEENLEGMLKKPIEPEKPTQPQPFGHISSLLDKNFFIPSSTEFISPLKGPNSFKKLYHQSIDSNIITYETESIRHGFSLDLNSVFIKFLKPEDLKSFHVEYEIHAANLPNPITGTIPIVLNIK